jgi:hypothetical protein
MKPIRRIWYYTGIMEQWNSGILGINPSFHFSNIPLFQNSIRIYRFLALFASEKGGVPARNI